MDNELQLFQYKNNQVRVVEKDGEPWFVAKDVCEILDISQYRHAIEKLDDDERVSVKVHTLGGEQTMTAISESGLYTLIMRSNKPEAKQFRRWVTGTVLPSIHKHGGYLTPAKAEEIINNPDTIIKLAEAVKAERAKAAELTAKNEFLETVNSNLTKENNILAAQAEENRPKVLFADAVSGSKDCILIGNFAKMLRQNGIKVGQTRLFEWFREHGWLMNTWDGRRNTPTQKAMDRGFFKVRENIGYVRGELKVFSPTPLLTGKGQQFFLDGFLSGRFQI